MSTYCEDKSYTHPANWNARIQIGKGRNMSAFERMLWSHEASSWVTCAVGNLCSVIPRDMFGAPCDNYLRFLGQQFSGAIHEDKFEEAGHILEKIEKRSGEILKEMGFYKNS